VIGFVFLLSAKVSLAGNLNITHNLLSSTPRHGSAFHKNVSKIVVNISTTILTV